jgi:uroporphyrinogen-III decarboxylase
MEIESYVGEPDVARLIAQIRGEPVDRVPHLEALVDDQHVERILGRHAGNTLAVGGDPAKGAEAATGRPMHGIDYVEFNKAIGQDALIVEAFWTPFKRRTPEGDLEPISDRSIKTRKDWEQVVLPDGSDIEDRLQYIREYREAVAGTGMGVTLGGGCFFQTLYEFTVGMTDMMMMTYEQRDLVEEMFDASADYFEKLVAASVFEGIDFLFFADDYAWKQGLFIPPQLFKELWFPRARRIIAPAVNAGIPVIFHSDGKIDDTIEWLIEIGIEGITPLDPYAIDYRDYKKRFGDRLCLFGNIDVEFPLVHGTPGDVERDVKEHADVLKPGGRWVASSSHSITNFIPHENFVTLINAYHQYGVY